MNSQDYLLIDDETLKKLRSFLIKRKETIAVAESVTGGILQTALSLTKDASRFFHGGITAYNLGQKSRHLHINPIHAEDCNCVSEKVAEEMARNVCTLFSSHWGIGVTGYGAIDPEINMKKPFAYFAIAYNNQTVTAGTLRHQEDELPLVQYYYVNEILKRFVAIAKKSTFK